MFRRFGSLIVAFVFSWLLLLVGQTKATADEVRGNAIQVIASIRPLTMIGAAVLPSDIELETLMKSSASPHGHALRPSDLTRLQKADVLLWVGPQLENFLVKAVVKSEKLQSITALDVLNLSGIQLSGHHHSENSHDHSALHSETHEINSNLDPHVWLDPDNALKISQSLVAEVTRLNPQITSALEKKQQGFEREIRELDTRLSQQLNPLKEQHFVVFHDAYSHLLNRYGLTHYRAFTVHPERRPGAKTVAELRQYVQDNDVKCVFSEPQFSNTHHKLLRDLKIKQAELDPLGSGIQINAGAYADMLEQMVDTISGCLRS